MFLFDESYEKFHMFGLSHILAIVFFIILTILIYRYRDVIKTKDTTIIRRILAGMMIINEIIFIIWNASRSGGFDTSMLPIGVCALSMIFTSIALWTNNIKIFKFIFYWALTGALISLVVANQTFEFPHFRYYHYFFNHGMFLMGNFYFLFVYRVKFSYKDLWKSGGPLLIYSIIMYPINFLLDDNHLFLRHVPDEAAPLYSFLGDFWVIGFITSIFLLFHILHYVVKGLGHWIYKEPAI